METRKLQYRVICDGLLFPEGPIAMADGSILVVEINGGRLTRVLPDGTKKVVADLVFIDPPYRMREVYGETLRVLADSSLIWAATMVIAEHEKKFDPGEEFGALRRFRHLAQGSTALSFYRLGASRELKV